MAIALEPAVITNDAGSPTAAVVQAMPVKPLWRSRTIQWLATGLLSSAGILALASDQLITLVQAQGQYLPSQWVSGAMMVLSLVGIVCKFAAMQKRLAVGDLTTGAK